MTGTKPTGIRHGTRTASTGKAGTGKASAGKANADRVRRVVDDDVSADLSPQGLKAFVIGEASDAAEFSRMNAIRDVLASSPTTGTTPRTPMRT